MDDELPILAAWIDFLAWLLPATEGFPHKARFTFSQRLHNLALDVVEDLVEARYSRDKLGVLRRANLRLEKIRVLLRLARQHRHLAARQHEFAARQLSEIGSMLGGWRRQQERR